MDKRLLRNIALMACHGAVLFLIAQFTLSQRDLDPSAMRTLAAFALAAAVGLGNAYLAACDFDKYLTIQPWQPRSKLGPRSSLAPSWAGTLCF